MLWNTSVPLLGLLASPITLIVSPVVAFNALMTLGLALSAWVMYLVARRWVGTGPAVVAGLLYGFGPPMIGASLGHLHLIVAIFPPLVLVLLDDLLVRRRSPLRTGLLLGLAAAAQFFIGSELLTTTVIVAALGLVVLAIEHRGLIRVSVAAGRDRLGDRHGGRGRAARPAGLVPLSRPAARHRFRAAARCDGLGSGQLSRP